MTEEDLAAEMNALMDAGAIVFNLAIAAARRDRIKAYNKLRSVHIHLKARHDETLKQFKLLRECPHPFIN